ncbi:MULTISPECIES: hypothetical protein [Sorangium]|uniref:CBM21 domain-containing protein n=1 Tax=Sorangium cellulosum TaxID=56 RepID=A0A4P2QJE1_SORCE|nr:MULTISPECIES: hypothetical protein [Sorangium]AUX29808.1 uncharacterized protein SOCE836_019010 [Sorangium cellulosum]WCQ89197.1 hypothetical protein NQZ70_01884 [Sorangium sp. Soce836]
MSGTTDIVRLAHATRKRGGDPPVSEVSGVILVDNIAYEKQVLIHYRDATGEWRDAPARYDSAPPWGSPERWVFSGILYPADYPEPARFAVRYLVAGREYWDNNGRHDYLLDPEGIVFGDAQLFGVDRLQRIVEFVGWRYHMDVIRLEESMPIFGRGHISRYKVTIGRSMGPGRYAHARCVGLAVRGADVSVLSYTACESIPPVELVSP